MSARTVRATDSSARFKIPPSSAAERSDFSAA
jgi:hypothetical protein